jgi:hypothetical protein
VVIFHAEEGNAGVPRTSLNVKQDGARNGVPSRLTGSGVIVPHY